MRRLLSVLLVLSLAGCAAPTPLETPAAEPTLANPDVRTWPGWAPSTLGDLTLESTDFTAGEEFPRSIELDRYNCDGPNIRPELHWSGVPAEAKSLVVTFTAEGGGPTDRWIAFDLPVDTTELPAAPGNEHPAVGKLAYAAVGTAMLGPCSLEGERWELWFTVYALDTTLDLNDGVGSVDFITAGQGHVLEAAELNGYHSYLAD